MITWLSYNTLYINIISEWNFLRVMYIIIIIVLGQIQEFRDCHSEWTLKQTLKWFSHKTPKQCICESENVRERERERARVRAHECVHMESKFSPVTISCILHNPSKFLMLKSSPRIQEDAVSHCLAPGADEGGVWEVWVRSLKSLPQIWHSTSRLY